MCYFCYPSCMCIGTECYTVMSRNICNDIHARTRLGVPSPDRSKYVWISTAFRQSPAKVCFQPPQEVCSTGTNSGPLPTQPSPSPPTPSICMYILCNSSYIDTFILLCGLLLRSPLRRIINVFRYCILQGSKALDSCPYLCCNYMQCSVCFAANTSPLRITAQDRSAIVGQHNKFRKNASPQAANMKKMVPMNDNACCSPLRSATNMYI